MKNIPTKSKALICLFLLPPLLGGCSPANIDEIKEVAETRFHELGFQITGYEGYQWGRHVWPGYGGAWVWYTLRRVPDNGVTYTGALQKWGDEYHNVYMRSYEAKHP